MVIYFLPFYSFKQICKETERHGCSGERSGGYGGRINGQKSTMWMVQRWSTHQAIWQVIFFNLDTEYETT